VNAHQRTEPADRAWFKSSYSSGEGGACVEVATAKGAVLIRDSKDLASPHLRVGRAGWACFVRYAAEG
jgi:hypothetical protein